MMHHAKQFVKQSELQADNKPRRCRAKCQLQAEIKEIMDTDKQAPGEASSVVERIQRWGFRSKSKYFPKLSSQSATVSFLFFCPFVKII